MKFLYSGLLLISISSICFTTILDSEAALEGLQNYIAPDDVHQVYGAPISSVVKSYPLNG